MTAEIPVVAQTPRLPFRFGLLVGKTEPTQAYETIHCVVGDEGELLIVAGDPALVLERTLL
jgi:hypothetical protein